MAVVVRGMEARNAKSAAPSCDSDHGVVHFCRQYLGHRLGYASGCPRCALRVRQSYWRDADSEELPRGPDIDGPGLDLHADWLNLT
jgi:hypothetical protein